MKGSSSMRREMSAINSPCGTIELTGFLRGFFNLRNECQNTWHVCIDAATVLFDDG